MPLEIHPLTRARFPDLVELFGRPGASIARGCFCMYYRRPGAVAGGASSAVNRAALKSLVDAGIVPGLLAYQDGKPVGWIAVGPREDYDKLARSPVMKPVDDRPAWSVVCFFVDARHRGKNLTRRLLDAAIRHARDHGAKLLEGFPVDKETRGPADFFWFGAKSIFDRAGFREVARRKPTRPVMRKALRGTGRRPSSTARSG